MSSISVETLELAIHSPLPPSLRSTADQDSLAHDARSRPNTSQRTSQTDSYPSSTSSALPPVDRGFAAWSFLISAFFIQAIVWGFPNSFGVFLQAYLNEESSIYAKQKNATNLLPLIGPLSSGIIYLSGIVIQPILAHYPHYRRTSVVLGAFLCFASLFGASYAKKVTELVALQGALYAIGGSLLYAGSIFYTSEWFITRRGLANGIIFSGTGVGGLILPILLSQLIQKNGTTKTLRILAICVGALFIPVLPFFKPRIPPSRVAGPNSTARRSAADRNPAAWLRSKRFWFLVVVNTIQGFGYFVPILWLPSFATDLKLGSTESSVILAVLNAATCIGRTLLGLLADKFDHASGPWFIALSTLIFSSFSTFVLWGVLSHTYAGLLVFGCAYGIMAGGWTSLWTGFTGPIARDDPSLTTTLLSYLLCSRGIGNILSTPISTSLLRSAGSGSTLGSLHHDTGNSSELDSGMSKLGFGVAGGRFEWVIVFVGTCFAGAAVVAMVGWAVEMRSARRGEE